MDKKMKAEVTQQFEMLLDVQAKLLSSPKEDWEKIIKLSPSMNHDRRDNIQRALLLLLVRTQTDKIIELLQTKKSFLAEERYSALWHYVVKNTLQQNTDLAKKLIPHVPNIKSTTSIGTWITNAINDDIRTFLIQHWELDKKEQPLSWYTANGERILLLPNPSVKAMIGAALTEQKPTIHPAMSDELKNAIKGLEPIRHLYPNRSDWFPIAKKILKDVLTNKNTSSQYEDLSWMSDLSI